MSERSPLRVLFVNPRSLALARALEEAQNYITVKMVGGNLSWDRSVRPFLEEMFPLHRDWRVRVHDPWTVSFFLPSKFRLERSSLLDFSTVLEEGMISFSAGDLLESSGSGELGDPVNIIIQLHGLPLQCRSDENFSEYLALFGDLVAVTEDLRFEVWTQCEIATFANVVIPNTVMMKIGGKLHLISIRVVAEVMKQNGTGKNQPMSLVPGSSLEVGPQDLGGEVLEGVTETTKIGAEEVLEDVVFIREGRVANALNISDDQPAWNLATRKSLRLKGISIWDKSSRRTKAPVRGRKDMGHVVDTVSSQKVVMKDGQLPSLKDFSGQNEELKELEIDNLLSVGDDIKRVGQLTDDDLDALCRNFKFGKFTYARKKMRLGALSKKRWKVTAPWRLTRKKRQGKEKSAEELVR